MDNADSNSIVDNSISPSYESRRTRVTNTGTTRSTSEPEAGKKKSNNYWEKDDWMPWLLIDMQIKGNNLPKNIYYKDRYTINKLISLKTGLQLYPSMVDKTITKDILSNIGEGVSSEKGKIYMYPSIPLSTSSLELTNTDPKHVLNSKYWWKIFLNKNKNNLPRVSPSKLRSIVENNINYIVDLYLESGKIISLKVEQGFKKNKRENITVGYKYFRIDSVKWKKYKAPVVEKTKTEIKLKILKEKYLKSKEEDSVIKIYNDDKEKQYNKLVHNFNEKQKKYNSDIEKLEQRIDKMWEKEIEEVKASVLSATEIKTKVKEINKKYKNLKQPGSSLDVSPKSLLRASFTDVLNLSTTEKNILFSKYDPLTDAIVKTLLDTIKSISKDVRNEWLTWYDIDLGSNVKCIPPFFTKEELNYNSKIRDIIKSITEIPHIDVYLKVYPDTINVSNIHSNFEAIVELPSIKGFILDKGFNYEKMTADYLVTLLGRSNLFNTIKMDGEYSLEYLIEESRAGRLDEIIKSKGKSRFIPLKGKLEYLYLTIVKNKKLGDHALKENTIKYYNTQQLLDSYNGGWYINQTEKSKSANITQNNIHFQAPSYYMISVELYITPVTDLDQSLTPFSILHCAQRAETIDKNLSEMLGYNITGFQDLLNNLPIKRRFIDNLSTYVPPILTNKFGRSTYNNEFKEKRKKLQEGKLYSKYADNIYKQMTLKHDVAELVKHRSKIGSNVKDRNGFDKDALSAITRAVGFDDNLNISGGSNKRKTKKYKKNKKSINKKNRSLRNINLIIKELYG